MSYRHLACSECLHDGDCLFQSNNDVESCCDCEEEELEAK